MNQILVLAIAIIVSGCSIMKESQLPQPNPAKATENTARILQVTATGEAQNYRFAVTVSSPDTGCNRYANWWEVITPEGELLYRRVLLHSHVDEQPFTRTGGTVAIEPQQEVIVRVHMFPDGYSSMARKGNVKSGFSVFVLPENWATSLESMEPLPKNCAF